ncbi:MAG: FAD-dependent oxidoreductase, partial [Lentisphaerae bacterium]
QALQEAGVTRYYHTEVQKIAAHAIEVNGETVRYDMVCDCRGPDAEDDLPQLRGVRGELLHVIAPDVKLRRPVRMMHPRYPLYIVPREDDRYVIGATKIESSDRSEISVRATLELLSAAYALHPGFAEARIIETNTHCRPAWRDNLPYLEYQPGLVRINGMYRHGFLIAPALCEVMTQKICGHEPEGAAARLIRIDGRRAYDEVDG